MRSTTIPLPNLLLTIASALQLCATTYEPAQLTPPKPQREFRAAWVATVGNIDWPSKRGLSTAEQKAEMLAILDRAAQLKLNAIILQVRPACDAMYASAIEPWSQYLSGTMGKPPKPFYDPLTFAVAEAHKRGLELHAWFNPYRALVKSTNSQPSATHVSKRRPELVRDYGKFLWLDPGEKEVQNYSVGVVLDVVKRYDVDGVHFDDYFYPYFEKGPDGKTLDFPDEASWKKAGAEGKLSRNDWRRENVNVFVERLSKSIKATKPWVKFGIAPFGIWRPGNPPQIKGMDAYNELYCDSRRWLLDGWVDYLTPQLYWQIDPPAQSFPVLLAWWTEHNPKNRHLWPGLNTGGGDKVKWKPDEIPRQIEITRRQPGVSGHVHWNMKSLNRNHALTETLATGLYAQPALIPATPWLDSVPPAKPSFRAASDADGRVKISWKPGGGEKVWLWLVQTRRGNEWSSEALPADERSRVFTGDAPEAIALSAVDRVGNASPPATLAARK